MVSKSIAMGPKAKARWAALCLALALALAYGMMPSQALAYYNRGSVSVDLGTTAVEVQAGATASVTVSITPSSDQQTEGCGMPKCPQGCAASCADENGQCRCAGADYKTYYPTAVASSSNASVAVASYSGGTLTVHGKSEGEAVITVRASLRQFNDAEAVLEVKVEGQAAQGASGGSAFVDVPDAAASSQDDKLDIVEKTVMGRPVHNVRIGESCDVQGRLALMAGVDGDVVFWEGDTYYHPRYSLTFTGTAYEADDVVPFDVALKVSAEAEGALNQPLAGMSDFVAVDFAHKGALMAPARVYALAEGALSDGDDVALYSYDEAGKRFVREEAPVAIVGGYAMFDAHEGKTYVVSSRDLTTEAQAIVTGGGKDASAQAGQDAQAASIAQELPPFALPALAVAAVAVVVAAVFAVRSRGREKDEAVAAKADGDER